MYVLESLNLAISLVSETNTIRQGKSIEGEGRISIDPTKETFVIPSPYTTWEKEFNIYF